MNHYEDKVLCTVIVPARNAASTIGACLDHLLNSDFPPIGREIIVIDNGSKDNTAKIISQYAVKYVLEPKVGRSHARNRGIKEARGEFIAFVDADCLVEPDWLKLLVEGVQRHEGIGGAQGQIVPVTKSTNTLLDEYRLFHKKFLWQYHAPGRGLMPFIELEAITQYPVINTAACLYRTKALKEVEGFDTSLDRLEDWDLALRVFYAGYSFISIAKAKARVTWGGRGWIDYITSRVQAAFHTNKVMHLWAIPHSLPELLLSIKAFTQLHIRNLKLHHKRHVLTRQAIKSLEMPGRILAHILFNVSEPRSSLAAQRKFVGQKSKISKDNSILLPTHWRFILLHRIVCIIDIKNKKSLILGESEAKELKDFIFNNKSEDEIPARLLKRLAEFNLEK